MVIVAFDVGHKRIGVAECDPLELVAAPVTTIQRRDTAAALEEAARLVRERGAEMVAVGLPVSFDGQLHAQARAVQSFGERLRRAVGVPLVYVDETLSSVRAEERLRAMGVRPDRLRERIDAAAAAVILQDLLDQRSRERTLATQFAATDEATVEAEAPGGDAGGREGERPSEEREHL